jgi:uncharacterized membrane protein HdeD (DUF308 family)
VDLKKVFSNILLLTIVAIVIAVSSIFISCYKNNWLWLSGSGALVTIIGITLSARPLIRMGYSKWRESQNTIECGSLFQTPEEIEEERQSDRDAEAHVIGLCMSVIGVIIGFFGSLLA